MLLFIKRIVHFIYNLQVGAVTGWKELLMSVGFRFEPASNGIPSSVFFPQSDPDERLTQCSASLQALLGETLNLHITGLKIPRKMFVFRFNKYFYPCTVKTDIKFGCSGRHHWRNSVRPIAVFLESIRHRKR